MSLMSNLFGWDLGSKEEESIVLNKAIERDRMQQAKSSSNPIDYGRISNDAQARLEYDDKIKRQRMENLVSSFGPGAVQNVGQKFVGGSLAKLVRKFIGKDLPDNLAKRVESKGKDMVFQKVDDYQIIHPNVLKEKEFVHFGNNVFDKTREFTGEPGVLFRPKGGVYGSSVNANHGWIDEMTNIASPRSGTDHFFFKIDPTEKVVQLTHNKVPSIIKSTSRNDLQNMVKKIEELNPTQSQYMLEKNNNDYRDIMNVLESKYLKKANNFSPFEFSKQHSYYINDAEVFKRPKFSNNLISWADAEQVIVRPNAVRQVEPSIKSSKIIGDKIDEFHNAMERYYR